MANLPPILGESFKLERLEFAQDRISKELAEKNLTAEQLKSITTTIDIRMRRTPRIDKATKPVYVAPNLDNATIAGIIDMLGRTREEMADLKKTEGLLKQVLSKRLEDAGIEVPLANMAEVEEEMPWFQKGGG